MSKTESDIKVISVNRSASHEYFLEDRLEAGMVLLGSEIKSIRAGHVQLKEAYVDINAAGEVFLLNAHIAIYEPSARTNHAPLRPRKLLLNRKEIRRLTAQVKLKGYTLVPTRLYLKKGRAKLEIALGKGKKLYDKRQTLAKRDAEMEMRRALKR